MSNIQYLKLSNGAEIIGEVVYEDNQNVSIKNALSVDQVANEEGSETIALFPYTAFNRHEHTNINSNLIITKYYINSSLKEYYELSLSFAKLHQERINKLIEEVNGQMRDRLFEMADDDLFGKYNGYIRSKAIN